MPIWGHADQFFAFWVQTLKKLSERVMHCSQHLIAADLYQIPTVLPICYRPSNPLGFIGRGMVKDLHRSCCSVAGFRKHFKFKTRGTVGTEGE